MNNKYNPEDIVMFTGDAKPFTSGTDYGWAKIGIDKLELKKEYTVERIHSNGRDFRLKNTTGLWYNEDQFSKINYKEGDYVVCVRESNEEIIDHPRRDNNMSLKKGTYCVVVKPCGDKINNTLSRYWLAVKPLMEGSEGGYICPTLVEPVTQKDMEKINKLLKIEKMKKEMKEGDIIKDNALGMYGRVVTIDFSNSTVKYINSKGTFETFFGHIEPFNFIITGNATIKKAFVDTANELKLRVTPPIDISKEPYTTSYFNKFDLFNYNLTNSLGVVSVDDSREGVIPLILPRDWHTALALVIDLYSVSEKEKALSELAKEIGRINGYPMTVEGGMTDKIHFGCREFDKKSLTILKEAGKVLKYIKQTGYDSYLTDSDIEIGDATISYEIIDEIINNLSD